MDHYWSGCDVGFTGSLVTLCHFSACRRAGRMSNINIYTSNWKKTGKIMTIPQYEMTILVDRDGREVSRTVQFPDCLFDLPAPYVKERITDLLTDYATIKVSAKAVE